MPNLPFDLATVDWMKVGTFAVIAFIAALIGNAVAMGNKLMGAILTAIFFAIIYVAWVYWLQAMVMPGAIPAATPAAP
jgi:hypothetical protein